MRPGLHVLSAASFLIGSGFLILSYRSYGWAALFLVLGALNLAGGYWFLTIARSARPRT